MLREWSRAQICQIQKKDTLCDNYRGVALLDTVYKIMAVVMRSHLNEFSEQPLGEYQARCRRNRSVTD